ncbi:MAG: hypothetical protein V3T58_03070 [Candidatus Hydrothermarchaeales archaeon]
MSIIEEIEGYVKREIAKLSQSQLATLKALLFSGYKGERDYVLKELLKNMGREGISPSALTESFTSSFEGDVEEARYYRIKPEFYRAVRKELLER